MFQVHATRGGDPLFMTLTRSDVLVVTNQLFLIPDDSSPPNKFVDSTHQSVRYQKVSANMNKLKSLFKKDKDGESESTSQSGSYGSGQQTTGGSNTGYAQGGGAGDYQQQSTPQMQQTQATPAATSQQPTGTSFPPNDAPSTGAEYADNAEGVVLHTTLGDITIALFSQQTPRVRIYYPNPFNPSETNKNKQTCKNFATLAATGKYDNVIFHRIIPGFMIQGGDPDGTGRGGKSIYGGKFEDEFVSDLRHTGKGMLSMANAGPNTNGSQFFITLGATPHLDGKHTVFGQVADGMDVVDRLGGVRTGSQDRPVQEVKIMRCDVF